MGGFGIDGAGGLWAVTSYFNPAGYRTRLANYRIFRERLTVPLVTVELAFGAEFELGNGDADVLVQLRGGDVMWQKERLLNIALTALPDTCDKVAWLDCDIVFCNEDWPAHASATLDRVQLVQLFDKVYYMPPGVSGRYARSCAEASRISLCSGVTSGLPAVECLDQALQQMVGHFAPGLAWAAQRNLIERHGFYEHCILGGGDRALSCAAFGCFDHLTRHCNLNARQFSHYMEWAGAFHEDVHARVETIDGDICHLWHGKLEHRAYYRRFANVQRFGFNPYEDIAAGDNEAWQWASAKPGLQALVGDFLRGRKEDG